MTQTQIQINYEDMLKSGMHFGRKKTVFNPKMKKYVYTVKEGICIIDLLKTQIELNSVVETMNNILKENGTILFVAPTKHSVDSVKGLANDLGMPYVLDRWIGGTLTNFKEITARVRRLEVMEKKQKTGELDKYTKKERLLFNRELKKMETHFGGLRKLAKLPDLVFVASLKEGAISIKEAKKLSISAIAIANTDSNPDDVDNVIPANDRSKKSVDLIVEAIRNSLKSKV